MSRKADTTPGEAAAATTASISSAIEPSSDYIICGNVRHVRPYIYEFSTHAKGRWLNRQLLDVVCQEFGGLGYNREFWQHAILDGHIKINNKSVSIDYVLRNSDFLTRKTHRHEPPVYGQVTVVGETEKLFAVSKPASLPMHPCGAYCTNSLSQILIKEFQPILNGTQLYQIHRLDRVTSGLVVMAKSKTAARSMCDQIQSRHTRKSYFARVKGRFPQNLAKLRDFSKCGSDVTGGVVAGVDCRDSGAKEACAVAAAGLSVQRLVELVNEDNAQLQIANSYKSTSSKHDNSNVTSSKRKRTDVAQAVPESVCARDPVSVPEETVIPPEVQIPTGYKVCSREEIAGYWPLIERLYRQCNPTYDGCSGEGSALAPVTYCVQVPLVTVSHKEGIHAADLTGASCCCFQATVDRTVVGAEHIAVGSDCSSATAESADGAGSSSGPKLLKAKPQYALSLFTAMGYDAESDTSLVLCSPITGRTHQLRIHLQVLDNPIANDVCYGGELFAHESGDKVQAALAAYRLHLERGTADAVAIPHIEALWRKHTAPADEVTSTPGAATTNAQAAPTEAVEMATAGANYNHLLLNAFTALGNKQSGSAASQSINSSHIQLAGDANPYLDRRQDGETDEEHIIRTCSYCREAEALELHQSMHCEGIYLHAYCYESDGWGFETPWPDWSHVFRKNTPV